MRSAPDEHVRHESRPVEMGPEASAGPSLTVRLARYLPTLILAGLAVHILLPQWATLENSLDVIKRMSLLAVAAAVVAQILSYVGNGYLLKSLVAFVRHRLALLRAVMIVLASSSVGLLAGGVVGTSAATYRLMRRSGVDQQGALMAGWFPSLFNNAVLLVLGLAGLLQLLVLHHLSGPLAIGSSIVVLLLAAYAGIIVWGLYNQSRLATLVERLSRRWARLRHRRYDPSATKQSLQHVFDAWDLFRSGGWRGPALGAVLNSLFDMLTLYLIFIAAGHRVSPGLLLAGYGLPLLIGKFTFLPGGVGVVEGSMAAMYTALGVPHAVTVVVILGYRILSFWWPTVWGFPLYVYLQHSGSDDATAEAD
jgi:glycosyltransferase 2 family protein